MNKKSLLAFMFGSMIFTSSLAEGTKELTTDHQKISYAIGLQTAKNLLQQGFQIDSKAFTLGIEDSLANKDPRVPVKELQAAFERQQAELNKERSVRAEKNREAGKAFLAENKKKEGVQELANGIQYRVLQEGKGNKPKLSDTVTVHYRGTLIDGKEFDSSYSRGEPTSLQLANVIKGWQEVVPMMSEGSKWQVVIPGDLAYGERGGGAIGPNETLLFDIELVDIKPLEDKSSEKKKSPEK
jgi:FKBP-type peptidyl-prolyl cis-trans isomerase FklB